MSCDIVQWQELCAPSSEELRVLLSKHAPVASELTLVLSHAEDIHSSLHRVLEICGQRLCASGMLVRRVRLISAGVFEGSERVARFGLPTTELASEQVPWAILARGAAACRADPQTLLFPIIRGEQLWGFCSIERKDALLPPTEAELTLLWIATGVIRGVVGQLDVELRLREQEQFLRRIIDTDPNFIFVKDTIGKFTLVNKAVADCFGMPAEQIVGKTDRELNPNSEEVRFFRRIDKEVLRTQQECFIPEERITDAAGRERWLQTVKRPLSLYGERGQYVLGCSSDITRRRTLEQQLMHAQKMDAVGTLAGGIAHDFNNLITAILGNLTLLRIEDAVGGSGINACDAIETAAVRAQELTAQLLGFAQKGKNQNSTFNLNQVLTELCRLLERTIGTQVEFVTEFPDESLVITGDPVQFQQVVLNLVLNARDAVLEQGRKSLDTYRGTVRISTGRDDFKGGDWVTVTVSDTGCGMSEDTQARIFEPFYTTKGPGAGTGMGLAMVYGIVTNHDGVITVESAVNKGSRFVVRIPASQRAISWSPSAVKWIQLPRGSGRILIVDDDPGIREVSAALLAHLGYEVLEAETGDEAIVLLQQHQGMIDVIVLDMVMPGLAGIRCVRAMRDIAPDTPIILSTGYGKNSEAQEILDAGAEGFIQKPYQLETLANELTRVLALQQRGTVAA